MMKSAFVQWHAATDQGAKINYYTKFNKEKKNRTQKTTGYSKEFIRSLKLKTTQSAFAATASRCWTPA